MDRARGENRRQMMSLASNPKHSRFSAITAGKRFTIGQSGRGAAARVLALSLAGLMLAGCATRPTALSLEPVGTVQTARTTQTAQAAQSHPREQRVFVATTRGLALQEGRKAFSDHRSMGGSYMIYDFSIPPNHKQSQIEWPKEGKTPDPATEFLVTQAQTADKAGFLRAVRGEGRQGRDVSLFIHGYNTSMPEAVFRAAQIATDADAGSAAVLFAWPSSAKVTAYVSDRDAADFSRPALANLIADLERTSGSGRVFVVGHSMGGRLTMEALLQLRLQGRTDVLNRAEIVLADPDIDVDLFWQQMAQIGKLPVPITVMTATDDKALLVSRTLAGGRTRIGAINVTDPSVQAKAEAYGVRLVDVSDMETDMMAHGRLMQIAALYDHVPASRPGEGLRRAGAFMIGSFGQGIIEVGDSFAR